MEVNFIDTGRQQPPALLVQLVASQRSDNAQGSPVAQIQLADPGLPSTRAHSATLALLACPASPASSTTAPAQPIDSRVKTDAPAVENSGHPGLPPVFRRTYPIPQAMLARAEPTPFTTIKTPDSGMRGEMAKALIKQRPPREVFTSTAPPAAIQAFRNTSFDEIDYQLVMSAAENWKPTRHSTILRSQFLRSVAKYLADLRQFSGARRIIRAPWLSGTLLETIVISLIVPGMQEQENLLDLRYVERAGSTIGWQLWLTRWDDLCAIFSTAVSDTKWFEGTDLQPLWNDEVGRPPQGGMLRWVVDTEHPFVIEVDHVKAQCRLARGFYAVTRFINRVSPFNNSKWLEEDISVTPRLNPRKAPKPYTNMAIADDLVTIDYLDDAQENYRSLPKKSRNWSVLLDIIRKIVT